MNEIFTKRMKTVMQHGSLGAKLVEDSNVIMDKTFSSDSNFRTGMLYDWDMNEIENVEFKFEKIKSYSAEGLSVEYMIHFRPGFNPECKYKNLYYKKDSRERLGFYIDVLDRSKGVYEKWMIVGKDDRVAFDRYNALKCDWCFEWISDGQYHQCIGCIRSAQDGSVNSMLKNELGGTMVNDELSIFFPSTKEVSTIKLGTRFIISDNMVNPWVYEVIRVKDTTPLGTTKVYLKQTLFNPHTDVCGVVNEMNDCQFRFVLPLKDLPIDYGGKFHMICDCLVSKEFTKQQPVDIDWKLSCNSKQLYINGQTVMVEAIPSVSTTSNCNWNIYIDGVKYAIKDIQDYFNIIIDGDVLYIKAINKVMVKYVVKIEVCNDLNEVCDSIEMEVCI